MHALTLLVPADCGRRASATRSPTTSTRSRPRSRTPTPAAPPKQPVFDEPGVAATALAPRPRQRAVRRRGRGDGSGHRARARPWAATAFAIVAIAAVADHDWVRLTQAQFGPSEVAPGFWIVPTWSQVPANAHQVIRLDPGRAFGTGSHPTTRMCLRWIAGKGSSTGVAWPTRARLRHRLGRAGDRGESIRRRRGRRGRHRSRPRSRRPKRTHAPTASHSAPACPTASPGRIRWSSPTSWPRRSSCSRRCCARWSPTAARSCSRASSRARPTS